jgi:hypothetical protein
MSEFDLNRLAERLKSAAGRLKGLSVTVSNNDLMFSKGGYGTGQSEAIPFSALFLRDDDVIEQALTRLCGSADQSGGKSSVTEDDAPSDSTVTTADAPSMSVEIGDLEMVQHEGR